MTHERTLTRRRFTALAATASLSATLAGCTGSNSSASADSGQNQAESEPAATTEPAESGGDSAGGDAAKQSFDGWFDGVKNYDGVVDKTGSDTVTVDVGVEANGGAFGFGPAAIRVSKGTTVAWEWTGDGGSHNVVETDGAFESEMVGDSGHTFEHTFEEAGTFTYSCVPHETLGMKGAVVVE
ncbi:halocyanin domain-containing protein [Haloferax mediterranei ATCC 33500]|uniref:Halocyanin n=1 Tax=Haloferax mediterranei (strain ATCC 33500 / DSM 1411 / JCM 8866 / NBRC 14739 / NCIMB 2177 / R-4) TaxID=523841 RepID=I3R6L5_HALMT|nr:halocyanin domain-containing protein [Haloferax mediterranei]AFK19875.1 halocyanin precursor-like protein [Haloferax mediterranei ATCC 33500]AHZ23255.1 halocyanin [Haloferax mediterranei ATCC 33500]ELZ99842.1 halocyanin precursor-like protein [Haloferax mediterranei ATCC 33500]MDX5987376.1 halocyanin domain-containing protein [Haloferax mediterranei ATCC 33500]QCQ73884.1 halocyanin domain-containing protein [Haloferax mediterranei ATCC 33500]